MTSDILHLTEVNPHVVSTLGTAFQAHMPRQPGGAPHAGGGACTGISGFAFQGTNAHVILGRWARAYHDSVILPDCAIHAALPILTRCPQILTMT